MTLFEKLFPMKAQELRYEKRLKELRALLAQEVKLGESKQRQIIELVKQRDVYKRQCKTEYTLQQETLLNAVMGDRAALLAENASLRRTIRVYERQNKDAIL